MRVGQSAFGYDGPLRGEGVGGGYRAHERLVEERRAGEARQVAGPHADDHVELALRQQFVIPRHPGGDERQDAAPPQVGFQHKLTGSTWPANRRAGYSGRIKRTDFRSNRYSMP